ncbi:MAG: Short-chain dehydrogenase [Ramlibacter sp.]|nr:Short-chain dehydrogenase [Ramlibacter sp.]
MTSSHLTILTGASRGMGHAMAEQLIAAGHDLLCISRKTDDALSGQASRRGVACEQWPHDLARPESAAAKLETWLSRRDGAGLESITLINNAGLLPRIAPLGDIPARDLSDALRVDLEAPMLLTGAFLRATASWKAQRRILNISSGLGRRAMASQAAYCAAKAGMDHFSRCVALEEADRANGARICSLAPGVIDTDMQVHLRSADSGHFPDVGTFIGLKDKGVLASPEQAAASVLAFLARPDFGASPVADIRD